MKTWQIGCIVGGYAVTAAVALTAIGQAVGRPPSTPRPIMLAAADEADVLARPVLGHVALPFTVYFDI